MKIAVFSDIHSNHIALEACLKDIEDKGIDIVIYLGDHLSDYANPQATLKLLYETRNKYKTIFIKGNREDYLLEYHRKEIDFQVGSKTGSLYYTYHLLKKEDIEFIKNMKEYELVNEQCVQFEIAHAIKGNNRYLFFDYDKEFIDDLFNQMQTTLFITGHSHKQYIMSKGNKIILNPGSVGISFNGYAEYAILEYNGNWKIDLCKCEYDKQKVIEEQFDSGFVDVANIWALCGCYTIIRNENVTMQVHHAVRSYCEKHQEDINQEWIWEKISQDYNIKKTKKEVLEDYRRVQNENW